MIELDALLRTHKLCTRCQCYKPHSDFSANLSKNDGLFVWCKQCFRDHRRPLDRERFILLMQNSETASKIRSQSRARGNNKTKEYNARKSREYRAKNKDKIKTRNITKYAIQTGIVVRLPCEVCGCEKSEAHHDDYSKPLEVKWLCKNHHAEIHRKIY